VQLIIVSDRMIIKKFFIIFPFITVSIATKKL
jgi:hypothetical protein